MFVSFRHRSFEIAFYICLSVQTLEREVKGRKPVLEEIEKLVAKLLADTSIRDEEKVHIQEEMEILQERWKKLHVKIHDNNKW